MTTFSTSSKPDHVEILLARFPDPPEHPEDKMTSFDHLTGNGNAYHLRQHLGNLETTLVAGERYLSVSAGWDPVAVRYPDMLVAFEVDPEVYYSRNGYLIPEMGKPPDFVLEIASRRSGKVDTTEKRRDYARMGVKEYWRFDKTGEHHGSRLGGDVLVGDAYIEVDIEELSNGDLQGYSSVLDLYLRWHDHELVFYDPLTGDPIRTFADERARADYEQDVRLAAEARIREVEAHNRELEERLREARLSNGWETSE